MSFKNNNPSFNALTKIGIGTELKPGDKIQISENIYIYWSKGYAIDSFSFDNAFFILQKDIKPEYTKSYIKLALEKDTKVIILNNYEIQIINTFTNSHSKKMYDFINKCKVFKRIK